MFKILKELRFWLVLWGGVGLLGVTYLIVSASVSPRQEEPSALAQNASLLTGEMAEFQYSLMRPLAPTVPFLYEGEEITLADFRGRAVLVNIWATTCAPCLKELPDLDALEARLGDADFEVVAVAADPKGPEAAQVFLDRLKIDNLKLYADPRLRFAFSLGGVDVMPISVLFDANGREVGRLVGAADWSSPEAVRLAASVKP